VGCPRIHIGFRIGWVLIRVILAWIDFLEEPIHDDEMKVSTLSPMGSDSLARAR